MKNSGEAAQMESSDGRAAYAAAVTQGIVSYLIHKVPAWRTKALRGKAFDAAWLR